LSSLNKRISYALKLVTLIGTAKNCPICHWHFRRFYPYGNPAAVLKQTECVGAGLRENVVCPRCGSSDKERHMYLYLKQAIARLPKRTRLLHIAPEKNLSPFLRSQANLEYLSADIDPKTAMLQMDITKIKFPDYSFDVIVCSHVLEHVREERRAMAEFYRVLRPGGWAMLQVPYSPVLESTYEDDSIVSASERTVRCGQEDHVRIYGLDHVTRLQNAGFEVETYSYAAEFGRQAAQRYGLILNELLFIAHKREA